MIIFAILLALAAYIYWRLAAANTDIRRANVYVSDDEQIVYHIQPRQGEPLPRS